MKTVIYEKYGGPEVLRIIDTPVPAPKESEILVKVVATTVTLADVRLRKADPWLARAMNGFITPKNKVLGQEFSGIVEKTGSGVTRFKPGDNVFGTSGIRMGTHAEYICIDERSAVTLKPENVDHHSAAAAPFGSMTSLHFLRLGDTGPGKKILIHGASGNLGSAAVQLAVGMGAEVSGVCSAANASLVKSLGATGVIDYNSETIQHLKDHFDIIYDSAGRSSFRHSVNALKKGGIYLRAVHFSPGDLFRGIIQNLKGKVKVIGGMYNDAPADLETIRELLANETLKPVIHSSFPMSRIAEAHRIADSGHKRGSVVVIPGE